MATAAALCAAVVTTCVVPSPAEARTTVDNVVEAAPPTGRDRVETQPLCGTPAAGEASCFAVRRTDVQSGTAFGAAGQDPAGYGPADLRDAYGLPTGGGTGLTVAVVVAHDAPKAEEDLAVYRAQYGLPACTGADGCFTKVDQRGGTSYPEPDEGWAGEAALDLDMVSAAAPDARLLLVEADGPEIENLGAAVQQAVALGADVVSNSYGTRYSLFEEDPAVTAWDSYYDHPGVAVVASSGDDNHGVSFPAASPHVTAVGGTTLRRDTGAARGWSESVWSHDGYGAGSGCSRYLPKPAFQKDTGCEKRTVADVSAVADPATGVAVYNSFGSTGWNVYGGTSASAPLIAGVYATAGRPAEGSEPNTYPYAADGPALNDVTAGSNGTCAPAYLCAAGTGYDGPTGLGTPNGLDAFRMGPHGRLSGTVTDSRTGKAVAGASVTAGSDYRTDTDGQGRYALTLPAGKHDVTVDAYGYGTLRVGGVTVDDGDVLTRDLAIHTVPSRTVSGTVTDASGHGWPLYASITVDGAPQAPVWTDPRTGRYEVSLPVDHHYTLRVASAYPGYQAASRTVELGRTSRTLDIGVPVDAGTATAPGYEVKRSGSTEPFASAVSAPGGWSVSNAEGTTGGWVFDDPAGRGNTTGGDGAFAVADSDHYGSDVTQDSQLLSPAYDLTGRTVPYVAFDTDYRGYEEQSASVDVSTDHGRSWTSVWKHSADSVAGPARVEIPLTGYAGLADVRLRFHFTGSFGWLWAVDNVFVGDRTYDAVPGGLVVGRTVDANTSDPVDGVRVTGVEGSSPRPAVSAATPADPGLDDGFFWLFAPTGDAARSAVQPLTGARHLYSDRTEKVRVVRDRTVHQVLSLEAGRIKVSPGTIERTVRSGHTVRQKVTLRNTGGAAATVTLHEATEAVTGPPPGDTWQSLPGLPYGIIDNAVDTYRGIVYSGFGMEGDDTVQRQLHAYDPAAGEGAAWKELAPAPEARRGTVHGFIDGKWYVAGGKNDSGANVREVAVYDPATDTWSSRAAAPAAYSLSGSAVLDGRLYMIGGCADSCGVTRAQAYDVASDSWRTLAPYPLPIAYLACGGVDGHVVCAGGQTPGTGVVDSAYSYDPATDTWSPAAALPVGLWGSAYTTANDLLLVSGGSTGSAAAASVTGRGFAYDPDTDAWTPLPGSGTPVYRGGAGAGLYKVGGSTGNGSSNGVTTAEYLPGYALPGSTDVRWLGVSAKKVTVPAHSSVTVETVLDAATAATRKAGTYRAALGATHDTPYPLAPVTVTMKVTTGRHGH
ncbi:carboxypeptidase regulatory-like domain-containing protein [Streptomyces sp. NBC_00178]|uniref:carboxypeptidase regulatory-like domain-containing protein n=1 Tax=Streptomyces sp. NBC_00178 TaxID=2975672 RepID=UPI002E2BB0BC|nr:carboxypeptidase regulatory-like domain-containing protein [Streptomyces sp. NBC_00178]